MLRPLLIFASLLAPAQTADEALTGDAKALQGTWTAMVGPNKDFPITLMVEKKAVKVTFTMPDGMEVELKGELKLDEKKTPKEWDWAGFTLPDGTTPPTNLAIYEVAGDELKVCSGGPDKPRPTEFKDDPSGNPNLVVFTRKKAEEKK